MKIESRNAAFSGKQNNSTEPAAQPAKERPVTSDALATICGGEKLSVDSVFDLGPSRPNPMAPQPAPIAAKQGPFARLPLELQGEILSWLKYENEQMQQTPRAVSRALYQASAIGLPEVNDRITSGYLRKILRQENFTQTDELETFFVKYAPKMQVINLANSYRQKNAAKAALLHRLLNRPAAAPQAIILRGCWAMLELPQELTKVSGDLDLSDTGITQLTQGMTVGGSLYISFTAITQLPQGLTVGGNLLLSGTSITQLPQGLTVGGSLSLSDARISQLPLGLTVGGNLYLYGTGITQLPEDLKVAGRILR